MKKLLLVFFIIMLFFGFIAHNNSNPKIIISKLLNKENIRLGELRYRIYLFGILPVGEAVLVTEKMEEYKGQNIYHLQATAQTSKLFSKLFSGSVILDSYVDRQQFDPVLFKQKLKITGKDDIDQEIIYDQNQGIMSVDGTERKILPRTQDPLSLVLNLKRMDFDKVKEFQMNINTNQKNYILDAKAKQKNISIGKKKYKVILVNGEISRCDKNPYHKSNISVALWGNHGNIPIFVKVFSGGALINAKLVDIK